MQDLQYKSTGLNNSRGAEGRVVAGCEKELQEPQKPTPLPLGRSGFLGVKPQLKVSSTRFLILLVLF
jgi:hypothetical protein